MKILALETSTRHFSVALLNGDRITAAKSFKLEKVLSPVIIPSISGVLKKGKVLLQDLDALAIGLGPGSFTGLRAGLATVKALAFALQKKIIGVASLDALAFGAPENHLPICTVCDAKRNLFYCCFYEKKNGQLKKKTDHLLINADELSKLIKEKTYFVGDGIPLLQEKLAYNKNGQHVFSLEKFWYPQASSLAILARERFLNKKFDSIKRIIPLYLYPDDCQVNSHEKRS